MPGSADQDRFRGLPVAVVSLDRNQVIRHIDKAFCEIFECVPMDILDRSFDDLFSPRDRRASLEYATKMSRYSDGLIDLLVTFRIRGREYAARIRLTERDGGFVVFVEPAFGADNLLQHFAAVEQRWKGTVRSSGDGIVIVNQDGCIEEHNARFYSLMGFRDAHGVSLSEGAVVGRNFLDLVRSDFPGLAAFLTNPEGELTTRSTNVHRCLEVKAMPMALPTGTDLGTFMMVRDITEELQVIARDQIIRANLVHARSFQRAILTAPPAIPGYRVDVAYHPLDVVGGDIYDVAIIDDEIVRLFIADATGHGVPAALVTMLLKSAYEFVKYERSGPACVLKNLNDRVASTHANLDVMCTAAVVDVNLRTREVCHSSAGHPPVLVVRDGRVDELESGGTFVGVEAGKTFPSWRRQLHPDASLYLVTDGIAESRRPNGDFFGDERLHEVLAEANELGTDVGEAVLMRLERWLRPNALDDDATIVSLRPS